MFDGKTPIEGHPAMATQIQVENAAALVELGLEDKGSPHPGAPKTLKITEETVKKVESLVGSTVTVDAEGKLVVS